jgi:hypothetical protein
MRGEIGRLYALTQWFIGLTAIGNPGRSAERREGAAKTAG